jgi:glycine dehydrogenase subunit 2
MTVDETTGFHQAKYREPILFEMGAPGRVGVNFPKMPKEIIEKYSNFQDFLPENMVRVSDPELPELSAPEVVRHFTRLSQMSYGVDINTYPLGSCTMKYTPKLCMELSGHPNVMDLHPYQPPETVQGAIRIMYELQNMLAEIGGVDSVTLQPAAGAAGEFTGLLLTRAFHEFKGEERSEVILPDTAHGTNPASAVMAGYKVVEIPSDNGCVDLNALEAALSENTAAFMLTNPNTLGIFEHDVLEIAKLVHNVGAILYYDGANLNAIMGKARPGDMGYDIVHFNLHKTFSTPHGGGGPGGGPIGVKSELAKFLPVPLAAYDQEKNKYYLDFDISNTIGNIKGFYGNFNVMVKAYLYLRLMGSEGLIDIAELATLNSNYMKEKLKGVYNMPYKDLRKHEFVLSGNVLKEHGLRTVDVAKRLMDYGLHAPTVYFPLIVDEAFMIEPTENESKDELDKYIEVMLKIAQEAKDNPEQIQSAPHNAPVSRIDEVYAVKNLLLSWRMYKAKCDAEGKPMRCLV